MRQGAFLLRRLLPQRRLLPPLRNSFSSVGPARPNPEGSPEPKPSQQDTQSQTPPDDDLPSAPPNTTIPPSTTTTVQPLIYPSSPSPHHTDLPSFLAHASRTQLDPSSTVYVGTHFEYTVLHTLSSSRYGIHLRRVGGASDFGIDLLGTWALPSVPQPLRVLAQCKAVQRPGPHLIRELEGAFVGAPAGWRGSRGVVGLLVTEKPATKGIREALARSRWPMGFVACSREGVVSQFLWNGRAEGEGLEGGGGGMRYVDGGGGGEQGRELVLTWRGRNLTFPGVQDEG